MANYKNAHPETVTAPRNQASMAYGRLRQDIVAGRLAPEQRLKIADLAERIDVSPGAIREALSRLVAEHLVVSRDQKGFVVAPLSIEDLEDLTELRCEIEAIALRRSVEQGGLEWEAGVLAAAHRLRRTPQFAPGVPPSLDPTWVERHAAFHAALVSACGSKRLISLHHQLYEQSERYRGLSVQIDTNREVADEHNAIFNAAMNRDVELLVKLSVEHFRRTTALIIQSANSD